MQVPLDRSLASWIRELEKEDKLYKFYKTQDWQMLRNEVLEEAHYECEKCRERGLYSRAKLVHHKNEVRDRPDLALSKYYTDEEGTTKKNLLALCQNCHEEEHERAYIGQTNSPKGFTNEERW
jgi:5-methylcytosine-specific restriction endonuclease McrA